MHKVEARFLRYVHKYTASNETFTTCPSTKGQLVFAKELVKELKEIGLREVDLDKNGYVMALLPASPGIKAPIAGFIAHLDTSPDFPGENIKPQIVRNYPGGDILLNQKEQIYMREKEFPELRNYLGQDLIVTDGTTLLGADDKAGVAEIISAMEFLIENPQILHGPIRIAFTPDEEIGRGAGFFDVKKFGAVFAYTVDGGEIGQLEKENFNAASAAYTIRGTSVHPGSAKGKMINSLLIAGEIMASFPPEETPGYTKGYEGFYHLHDLVGSVEKTELRYIIRDHCREKFEERKAKANLVKELINSNYNRELVTLELKDTYYNMKEILDEYPWVTELAHLAIKEVGLVPKLSPIRGGTDGARLSFMGLPTPNLFTGGHNFHGPYEFIPILSMEKAVEVIVKICELTTTLAQQKTGSS